MVIKVTLETQNGRSLLIGNYASLEDALSEIHGLDTAWERGDISTELLRNWEGSDVTATASAMILGQRETRKWLLTGDGPDDEAWEEI